MNLDFAARLEQPWYVADWAKKVVYNTELSADEKDMNAEADEYWKAVGRSGIDKDYLLSALITKALTPEVVSAPGELLGRMFVEGTIGEFDDSRLEYGPKNTLHAHEAVVGGNVDMSYIDHTVVTPTRVGLAIETSIPYQELRRGGYKNVANLVNMAREAFEQKKVSLVMNAVAAAISSGAANYITESTTRPTDTSMGELALYLADVTEDGTMFAFGLNKYIQAVGNLSNANSNKTDVEKSMWFRDGFLVRYSGVDLIGFSGQKRLADGSFIVPDNTLIGVGGKIGTLETVGSLNVYETMDNDSEKVRLKMNGYTFAYAVADITKVAKMAIASA